MQPEMRLLVLVLTRPDAKPPGTPAPCPGSKDCMWQRRPRPARSFPFLFSHPMMPMSSERFWHKCMRPIRTTIHILYIYAQNEPPRTTRRSSRPPDLPGGWKWQLWPPNLFYDTQTAASHCYTPEKCPRPIWVTLQGGIMGTWRGLQSNPVLARVSVYSYQLDKELMLLHRWSS